jgi:predicted RNA-binding protein YlqC (UPF0109 family)
MAVSAQTLDACALVSMMVGAIVFHSDEVEIVPIVSTGESVTTVNVIVARGDDRGRLIGRAGRTAHSMRIILQAVSRKQNTTIRLEILDESEARSQNRPSCAFAD